MPIDVQHCSAAKRRTPISIARVVALLGLLTAIGGALGAQAAAPPPARVSVADDARLVFGVRLEPHAIAPGRLEGTVAVSVPGFVRTGAPGEPLTLTRQFLVALPPVGGYSLTWRVLESKALGAQRLEPNPYPDGIRDDNLGPVTSERYEIDPAVYDAYRSPATVVTLEPATIRRQRVLPVLVSPVSYDPRSGELVLATSIEVEVAFRPSPERAAEVVVTESPMWEGVFGRLLVNPVQAAKWRVAPRITPSAVSPARLDGPHLKLRVRETGMQKVAGQALLDAGLPPGQPIADLHLFRRSYDEATLQAGIVDVSFTVEESATGTPGELDAGDLFVFYGRRLRDDPVQGDEIENYADHNVYWLGTTSGPMMATRSFAPGFVTGDTTLAAFPATDHFEVDAIFREAAPRGVDDRYYQNYGNEKGPIDLALRVAALAPRATLNITADLHGSRYGSPRTIRLSLVNSLGAVVLDPALSIPNKNRVVFETSVPRTSVVPGTNTFRLERPDESRATVEAQLNWVEVSYNSLYRVLGNTLRFNTASLFGDTSITVTGLDDTDVWLFDVTNPDAPVRCEVEPDLFVPTPGGGFALSFRDNVSSRKEYIVVPEDRMVTIPGGDVVADAPSAIIGSAAEGGVDVLVVSHASFVARMQEWVAYRRAQGYRVLLADVEDVYDEFNNGVPHARAIDRFVRRFFELGGAGALVLVGDSSEDNKRIHATSGPNLVPTHSFVDHVASLLEDEIVTTDKRFVKLPTAGGGVDPYPDLLVGRLPVASDAELQRVLGKIFSYEKPRASDFWRKRMVIIADDAYSEGSSTFGGFQFCFHASEVPFESGQERTARVIERSLPAGYDVVRFYLDDYSGPIHQQSCVGKLQAILYVRENINPLLMSELDQGATLVTIQSHMNRSLVCHEKLLSTESAAAMGSTFGKDHLRLKNRDKPFVVFGMGCHFSDYAIHKELDRALSNGPNGDAFAEQLLLANNIGAVATYGSSGFEYLGQTNAFMDMVSRVWFYEAPYDTMMVQTQGEWVFGELMFLVENKIAFSQASPVERYHILGDPMLRIDAGPPAFDVTVGGVPFESGTVVRSGGEGDTIRVVAVVTDENAIHDFGLWIDEQNRKGDLAVTRLSDLDPRLTRARQYRLEFSHKLVPRTYDIVVRAFQAPDTTAGQYHMAAEFTIRVEASVSLSVNGRVVQSGDIVPRKGDYLVEVRLPVVVPEDSVSVTIDGDPVSDAMLAHPTPEDSTTWLIRFTRTLSEGSHELVVQAGSANRFPFNLMVSSFVGLRSVINYPNPFKDTTNFVYTNDIEISDGSIDIFTVSGKRVRRLEIPPESRQPGQNAVFWDGRDAAGGDLANGVYLYAITVTQHGKSSTVRGKLARIQ